MSKFDHIDGQRLTKDRTADWVCPRTYGGELPILTVRPVAPTLNPAYTNAFVRTMGGAKALGAMQQRQMAARDYSKMGNRTRAADRELYPKHVVVGWSGVVDKHGQEVPFTEEDCGDFLAHIDDYVFDELRGFCLLPENFVDAGVVSDAEAEDQGNE